MDIKVINDGSLTIAQALGISPEREEALDAAMEAANTPEVDNYIPIIEAGIKASENINEATYCSVVTGVAIGMEVNLANALIGDDDSSES